MSAEHKPQGDVADWDSDPVADAAMTKVVAYAHSLGMHGVVILSPTCKHCGKLHAFGLYSDLEDTADLAGLLETMCKRVREETPNVLLVNRHAHGDRQ